jgi:CheY-like chemotaxis protein
MSRRILLIDDEPAIREVTRATLEIVAGWVVTEAGSGAAGVALAAADPPDAILLDVMMPDMDGPRALKELRASSATREVPVLFLTAKVQATDIKRFWDLGVQGVIAKPFDPMGLASEIAAFLGWEIESHHGKMQEG